MNNYTETDINALLLSLGIDSHYAGYHYIKYALQLIKEEPNCLLAITKQLYPQIAKKFNISISAVDSRIRSVSEISWNVNPALLQELTGHKLSRRLTVSQFLSVIYMNLSK